MTTDPLPRAPSDPSATARLDRSLAHGLAWTGLAKWGAQALSWASTLIVARLLTPADYGILGMAVAYLGLVQLVSELGLGAALVQRRDLASHDFARLGGLAILIGVFLFGVSAAVSPLIALFFRQAAVRAVVIVLATGFVITAVQVLPQSLLARDMNFRRLAFIEGTEAVVQTLLTLALAIAGARYWALVFGGLGAKLLSTILLLLARPHRLAWPRDLGGLRGTLALGGRVVVSRLTWYLYSNADFVIVGRLLGAVPLGHYTIGWNLASIPVDKVTALLGRVALPVLSEVQHDTKAIARYLLFLSEGMALVILPASCGLALVAADFVPVILGPHWHAAVLPLELLSLHVSFRCLSTLFAQGLLAVDDAQQNVRVGVVLAVILPVAFLLAAQRWGAPGVALAWLVVHPVVVVPMMFVHTMKRLQTPVLALARVLWPAASGTIVMMAAVIAVRQALAPGWLRLTSCVVAGAAAYGIALLLLHRRRVRGLVQSVRALFATARQGEPVSVSA